MDKVELVLPDRADPSVSPQYTLFPSRHRRPVAGARVKRTPEKLTVDLVSGRNTDCQYKIMSRRPRGSDDPSLSLRKDSGWPSIGTTDHVRPPSTNNKPGSFADMVRRKPSAPEEKDKPGISSAGANRGGSVSGKLRKTLGESKPVLNKISAFTYGQIGRSDDESKYVSSSRPQEDSKTKTIPSALRRDVLVEFKESDDEEEDFQVEFSSSAVVKKVNKNTVNKISAGTFQQIGKTADQARYVMQPPKSWSSIVGKNMGQLSARLEAPPQERKEQEKSREPSVHDKIKAKMKEGIELSPEEREILRQKRRFRRKREKELKKKEKEDKQIQDIYKPQTTKLNMISGDLLNKCKYVATDNKGKNLNENKIKFLDDEYPDLTGVKTVTKRVLSTEIRDEQGRLQSSERESNSEWETEDEHSELIEDLEKVDINVKEEVNVEVVTDKTENFSYSSILKSSKKPSQVKIVEIPDQTNKKLPDEKKKVKKHDPILFDITSALQVKKEKSKKKVTAVVTGLKKVNSSRTVRNQLDSTAPMKKRGKEREGGKRKRKTLMKKIIIADRERRRKETEKLQHKYNCETEVKVESSKVEIEFTENDQAIEENDEVNGQFSKSSQDKEMKTNNEEGDTVQRSIELREKKKELVDIETEAEVIEKFLESSLEEKALLSLHSRKFRTYCDHILSPELDNSVMALMSDLIRFQDKVHAKDPDKARAKRRYVVGLRESAKFLKVKKLLCIIFAPNIEKVEAEGGLDDAVGQLIKDAKSLNVSVVFSLNRYKLGRLCFKKVPISCIGILNYQGSDVSISVSRRINRKKLYIISGKLQEDVGAGWRVEGEVQSEAADRDR